jgi:hypothetical protein
MQNLKAYIGQPVEIMTLAHTGYTRRSEKTGDTSVNYVENCGDNIIEGILSAIDPKGESLTVTTQFRSRIYTFTVSTRNLAWLAVSELSESGKEASLRMSERAKSNAQSKK